MAAPIETGTMAAPLQYKSYTLNHLGLGVDLFGQMRL